MLNNEIENVFQSDMPVVGVQCDQMARLIIQQFTTIKICQKALKFAKVGSIFCQIPMNPKNSQTLKTSQSEILQHMVTLPVLHNAIKIWCDYFWATSE